MGSLKSTPGAITLAWRCKNSSLMLLRYCFLRKPRTSHVFEDRVDNSYPKQQMNADTVKKTFTTVIYPSNPDSCRVESQYWSLFQCSLCHHGAEKGWCRSGSLLWFPRHRSLNKRSSSTTLCNYHQLQKSNVS